MAVACKKSGYLGYTPGTGAPKITSVHTLTKADTVYINMTRSSPIMPPGIPR